MGNSTRLCFGKERLLIRRSPNALTDRLAPTVFFRANRMQAVNLAWVQNVDSSVTDGFVVILRSGQIVEFSRRQGVRLRERLSL